MTRYLILTCLCLGVSFNAIAKGYEELDYRLSNLEAQMQKARTSGGGQGSIGSIGLVEELQQMQEELRQLRGDVEQLQYEAQQQQNRQREMFLDIEKRLQALEGGRRPPATVGAAPGLIQAAPSGNPPATQQPSAIPGPAAGATAPAANPAPAEDIPAVPATPGPAQTQTANAQPPVSPPVSSQAGEQDAYLAAFEILKQGNYDEALNAFSGFLQQYPNGNYADNARYWLAETHYVKKQYPQALEHFQTLLAHHPDSSKLPGALLKLGYIHYEMGNNPEARQALERVKLEYADTNVATLAQQRLDRMNREGR